MTGVDEPDPEVLLSLTGEAEPELGCEEGPTVSVGNAFKQLFLGLSLKFIETIKLKALRHIIQEYTR